MLLKCLTMLCLLITGFASGQTIKSINKTDSLRADSLYKIGTERYNEGSFDFAIKAAVQAINLDSLQENYYYLFAEGLIAKQDYTNGLSVYSYAISKFPTSVWLYTERARNLELFMDFDAAIEDYTTALSLANADSTRSDLLSNRGSNKTNKRDFEGAEKDYMEALRINPKSYGALNNLSVLYGSTGRYKEAFIYIDKAAEVSGENLEVVLGNKGLTYQKMGEDKKAIEYFDKSLAQKPDNPLAYSNRSYSRLQIGDMEGAMTDIEKSIDLYPTNSWAYRNRALIYIKQGKTAKACKDLEYAIELGYTDMYDDEVEKLIAEHCTNK